MLGGAGLVICITFVWFSAPDLALTQLAVEIVTTVLILLGLRWLPKRIEPEQPQRRRTRARWRRRRDLLLAVVIGIGLAALSYAVHDAPGAAVDLALLPGACAAGGGGTNVVNVILVDFRGFDTLGEITVLAHRRRSPSIALLRRFRPPRESLQVPEQQRLAPEVAGRDLVDRTSRRTGCRTTWWYRPC